jgi:4a-hydroxytetrahydrobiopterin dehydratase
MKLYEKKCSACVGAVAPMSDTESKKFLNELGNDWKIINGKMLEKSYQFRNFREALAFVDRIGTLAEAEGHHPDLFLSWGLVKINLWTHKINGLSESDFVMAAKCDRIYS